MVLRLVDGLTTGFAVRLLVQWTGWGKERSIWSMVVWLLTDESPDYGSGLALLLAGWLSSVGVLAREVHWPSSPRCKSD